MISTVIQSYVGRRARAHILSAALDAPIHTDHGPVNPWRGYTACLRLPDPRPWTHRLVLQDDAILCHRFAEAAHMALLRAGPVPVCFCVTRYATGTTRLMLDACTRGDAWCEIHPSEPWVPCVATAWPRWVIPEILAYSASFHGGRPIADDQALADWRMLAKVPILCTVPCLVDHDDQLPSAAGNTSGWGDRTAMLFAGGCDPVREIDWSRGLV